MAASFDADRVLPVVPSLISSSLRFELSPPPFVASASWSIDAIDSSSLTSNIVKKLVYMNIFYKFSIDFHKIEISYVL